MNGTPSRPVDPIDRVIGQRIKLLRSIKETSQTRLGQAIGVSLQQVQKYESGANRLSAAALVRIALALGVRVEEIIADAYDYVATSESKPSQPLDVAVADQPLTASILDDPSIEALVRDFARLSDPGLRATVLSLARRLSEIAGGDLEGASGSARA